MTEIIEAVLLILLISGHSIFCFYAGYRYRQGEEHNEQ